MNSTSVRELPWKQIGGATHWGASPPSSASFMKASKEYFRNYYRERRQKYEKLLGGVCSYCGSSNNLQFHHLDESTKDFSIGKLMNYSESKVLEELEKCVLLCKSCHRRLHLNKGTFKNCGGRNEQSCGGNNIHARKVICIETGKCYDCMADCARDMNFPVTKHHIGSVCRGERKSYKGYTFRFIGV